MSQDVVFRRALSSLSRPLRDALAEAELDDPGLLRAYPRSSAAELGIGDHAPPLDQRGRLTKTGGGGSGMADTGAVLDTVVDIGMSILDTGRIAGGTGTLVGGSVVLSSISGAVPVVLPSSSSFFPSLSSPLPLVSDGVRPGEGTETLVWGTSSAGLVTEVSAEATESPSGGNLEIEKGIPDLESGPRMKGGRSAAVTAKAGKKKKAREAALGLKTAVSGETKSLNFSSKLRFDENPGEVRSAGQSGELEVLDGSSARMSSTPGAPSHFEAFDESSARMKSSAEALSHFERFDESSARMSSSAEALSHSEPSGETSAWMKSSPEALSHPFLPASPDSAAFSIPSVHDARLLYCTLVADGALPGGYEVEFDSLMRTVESAAERHAKAYAQLKPEDTTLWLLESEKKAQKEQDSFKAAWAQKPRRFRTKFERTLHMGHTPRKDAEEEERTRWIHELAQLVAGSQTQMGKLLREEPNNVKVLGAGLRASTLRSRVRHLRRFFTWLELTRGVLFPSELSQLTDYIRVRLSEPCNRGALKNTNEAFGFHEQVTGTPEAERHTSKELYQVVYRELRSNALPGRPTKQAPRMPVMLLEALERLVLDSDAAGFCLVGPPSELGNVAVLRPPRTQPI